LEKVSETIRKRKTENELLSTKDLPFILLQLPEANTIKKLLLEKILTIIATCPTTTAEHRQKISEHNDKIRDKLQDHFELEDKEFLNKQGLFPFWKYNNRYFFEAGGKHFNDPLPN